MENHIIERAARAAIAEVSRQTDGRWPHGGDDGLSILVDDDIDFAAVTRAVLQAIREPSPQVLAKGVEDFFIWDSDDDTQMVVRSVWQAMIDAALAEQTEHA